MTSDSVDKKCTFSKTTISLFLNMRQSGNYQPCYDDKCLSCPEPQMKWSVSDWDSLSSWPQDNKKVMHKNPMIQIEFFSLYQSCHLMQEAIFVCILQWQILYCKCLLAEGTIHLSVAPEVLLFVPILKQVPVLTVRNLMAHLLQWLKAASKHKFFCCHSGALQWWSDDSPALHWLLLIEEKEEQQETFSYLFIFLWYKQEMYHLRFSATQSLGTLIMHTKCISSPQGSVESPCTKELISASLKPEQFKCEPAWNTYWKPLSARRI